MKKIIADISDSMKLICTEVLAAARKKTLLLHKQICKIYIIFRKHRQMTTKTTAKLLDNTMNNKISQSKTHLCCKSVTLLQLIMAKATVLFNSAASSGL